jgi:hypothetical protein
VSPCAPLPSLKITFGHPRTPTDTHGHPRTPTDTHGRFLLSGDIDRGWEALISRRGWRREGFLNPFCHLVIRAIRVDSHPPNHDSELLKNTLLKTRLDLGLNPRPDGGEVKHNPCHACQLGTRPHQAPSPVMEQSSSSGRACFDACKQRIPPKPSVCGKPVLEPPSQSIIDIRG